jgi:hypothetical protein
MPQHAKILVIDVDPERQIEAAVGDRWSILRARDTDEAMLLAERNPVFVAISRLAPDR